MIKYNPKDWFTFIFRFHKADTFRKLIPMMIALAIYTLLIVCLQKFVWHLPNDYRLRNITQMHTMIGFVISLLLVFRTNTAYDRWWEGRKLWGGLVNNSRNLALKLNSILENKADKIFFSTMISNFNFSLKSHLINKTNNNQIESTEGFEVEKMDKSKHIPMQVLNIIFARINSLPEFKDGKNSNHLFINPELMSFADICGACERIKNTPIPFSYSSFIKKFIFFYIMTLPIGYTFILGYYSIPVVVFIFYVLASLELIAEEIEDPFGSDSNDLPIEKICQNIKKSVAEILL